MENFDYTAYDDSDTEETHYGGKGMCIPQTYEYPATAYRHRRAENVPCPEPVTESFATRYKKCVSIASQTSNVSHTSNASSKDTTEMTMIKNELFQTADDVKLYENNKEQPYLLVTRRFTYDGVFYNEKDVLRITKTSRLKKLTKLFTNSKPSARLQSDVRKSRVIADKLDNKRTSRRYHALSDLIAAGSLPLLVWQETSDQPLFLLGEQSLVVLLDILALRTKSDVSVYQFKRCWQLN